MLNPLLRRTDHPSAGGSLNLAWRPEFPKPAEDGWWALTNNIVLLLSPPLNLPKRPNPKGYSDGLARYGIGEADDFGRLPQRSQIHVVSSDRRGKHTNQSEEIEHLGTPLPTDAMGLEQLHEFIAR